MKIRKLPPLIWAFFLILTASCSSDEGQETTLTSDIVLRFVSQEVKTRANGSVDPGADDDNRIDRLSIWFFANGAMDSDAPLYKYTVPSTSMNAIGKAEIKITEKILGDAGLSNKGIYDIYVAANLTSDSPAMNATTLGELKSVDCSNSGANWVNSPLCMGGAVQGHNFAQSREVVIPLIRTAVKMEVKLINETTSTDWTITKAVVHNAQKKVSLFPPTTVPLSDVFSSTTVHSTQTTENPAIVNVFYVNENLTNTPLVLEISATIGGEDRKYKAEIKPEGAAKLLRNTVCMVTLRLKDAEVITPTDMEFVLKDWTPENMDETIHGSYLNISNHEVNVTYSTGGSLRVETDADKLHIDWRNAPGYYLVGYEGKTEADIIVENQNVIPEFRLSGSSEDVVPDGKVILTVGNLTQTITLKKEKDNILFQVASISIEGSRVANGGTIQLPLWNVGLNPTLTISMNCNARWAYSVNMYEATSGEKVYIAKEGVVQYEGINNSSAQITLQYAEEVYANDNAWPLKLIIDLFLLHHNQWGEKITTIECTVTK